MPAAFLYQNFIDQALFVGEIDARAIASLPLSNLLDPQPRVRARWIPAEASIYVDFGGPRPISCVAVIGTSLGTAFGFPSPASVRARVGPDAGFATSNWDSGFVSAGGDATGQSFNGNVVLLAPGAPTGRYLRIDIKDGPDAAYLDVGRIVAGPLWRPAYGPSYGMGEGRLVLDRRDRNPHSGAEFAVPALTNPRMVNFSLDLITSTEATTQFRWMLDQLGGAGDALWIPDDSLPGAELNARCIYGAVAQPGDAMLRRGNFAGHQRSFTIVERV